MALRISEAQQLFDGLNDPLLMPALTAFFEEQYKNTMEELLRAVCQHQRDTMKEARLAGKIAAYQDCESELRRFAEESLRSASQ